MIKLWDYFSWRRDAMTNYHESMHLGLSCRVQSYEPNIIRL